MKTILLSLSEHTCSLKISFSDEHYVRFSEATDLPKNDKEKYKLLERLLSKTMEDLDSIDEKNVVVEFSIFEIYKLNIDDLSHYEKEIIKETYTLSKLFSILPSFRLRTLLDE